MQRLIFGNLRPTPNALVNGQNFDMRLSSPQAETNMIKFIIQFGLDNSLHISGHET